MARADATQPNMALTSWEGGIVRKSDIFVAKNYLKEDEIDRLNRLTVIFLDTAEMRVKSRKDLTLDYWRKNVDNLLEFQDMDVLKDKGPISTKAMKTIVSERYDEFNETRRHYDAIQSDKDDFEELNKDLKEISKK